MDYKNLTISEIAEQINLHISKTGQKAGYCKQYIDAMLTLNSIHDNYGLDKGRTVVLYFLSNAATLKGGEMSAIKKELNWRVK